MSSLPEESSMTAKERVKRAVAYEEVDRPPAGLFGTHHEYEEGLAQFIGVDSVEDMYRELGVDIWHSRVGLEYKGTGNAWGKTEEKPRPFADMTTIDEVEAHPFAGTDYLDASNFIEHLKAHQEFAVCGGINSAIFHNYLDMCGQENGLCFLKTDPKLAKAMIRRITDYWEGYLRKLLEAGRGMIDLVENCNDFGTQRSMFISIDDFREFFKGPLTRLYNTAKEYGILYMQHSCGSIAPIIDDFIEMGADILNPIQVEADGMNLEELAQRYKGRITFYGGIDTQRLLPHGPEDAIRREVRRLRGLFGKEGGLIMAGSQGLLVDIPYPNAVAMLDENKKI